MVKKKGPGRPKKNPLEEKKPISKKKNKTRGLN